MWTLIVLLAGFNPPTGMIKYGFDSKLACMIEASEYCNPDNKFRCKCTDQLTRPTEEQFQ